MHVKCVEWARRLLGQGDAGLWLGTCPESHGWRPAHSSERHPFPRPETMTRFLVRAGLSVFVLLAASLTLTAFWSPWDEVRKGQSDGLVLAEPGRFQAVRDLGIPRLTVRLVQNDTAWAIDDHFLYVSADSGRTFERRGSIPKWEPSVLDRVRNRVARHPLVRRVRENRGPSSIAVLSSGTVLLFYDRIYRSEDGGWTFEALSRLDEQVYSPFPHGVAVDSSDRVYFGDYRTDERPHPVRVYRGTQDARVWEVCYEFPSGETFHVHSIDHDPHSDRVLIATGDHDEESGWYELDPDCSGVSPVGHGDQRWRLIAPVFREEAVFWGNDDNREGSEIFELRRGDSIPTPRQWIGKPAYHASLLSDGSMAISTTYEPQSRWSNREQPTRTAEIWISRRGSDWSILDSFEWVKSQELWGLSRALIRLPVSDGSLPYLFASPVASEAPFVTYRYRVTWVQKSDQSPWPLDH